MARKRAKSPSGFLDGELSTTFSLLPWWAGPPFAVVVYCLVRWPLAWVISPEDTTSALGGLRQVLHGLMPSFAVIASGFALTAWLGVQLKRWSSRRMLDSQTGLDSIRRLSWTEFEELLCEAFRREGCLVEHTGTNGPDGGIDIRLQKGTTRSIVQCKHWKREQVGVAIVREMFGLLHSEKADSAIVVTSGTFSSDAIEFATTNDIRLIDGSELVPLILSVQGSTAQPKTKAQRTAAVSPYEDKVETSQTPSTSVPSCPKCGGEMIRRIARKGANMGLHFWGCRRFPACNGTVKISPE